MSKTQTVYFAYGSNLHLAQMAKRCPESRYLGRGILPGFKWQINTRGYANVIISEGDHVEGLCFLLSQRDEERLDVSEGVPRAYEKQPMKIDVFAAKAMIAGRRVKEVIGNIHQEEPPRPYSSVSSTQYGDSQSSFRKPQSYHSRSSDTLNALVYVNWNETTDGAPKEEYIHRIRMGIADSRILGIPQEYFERYVYEPMRRRETWNRPQRAERLENRGPWSSADLEMLDPGEGGNSKFDERNMDQRGFRLVDIVEVSPHRDQVRSQTNNKRDIVLANATHRSHGVENGESNRGVVNMSRVTHVLALGVVNVVTIIFER